ncbi:helix-turn-helix domain-containing protein [Mycobacterium sp. 1245805.9]|uniref:helix-turn-helix domain-containing protein n=1 Tax=Mycobacterium sp. 1245805.9 TaxID=1856862 RepID=UPI0009ED1EE9|nr:helix-turn-helix domain-containing protein [Mycobacterium sp. 1245805.9]
MAEVRDLEPSMSIAEVCRVGNVSEKVVMGMIRSGKLPAVKFGGAWRIRPEVVAELLGISA